MRGWQRPVGAAVFSNLGAADRLHRRNRRRDRPAAADDGPGADDSARTFTDDVDAARCPSCGYTYVAAEGNEQEGFAAGTAWSEIPDDWCCPDCGVHDAVRACPVAALRLEG